ncbi:MAG: 4-hydroxy-tetrahydrodipicolinate reductase [Thermoguttaceae bacterium]
MTVRIAIHGAAGRMGRRLVALAAADPQLELAAALEAAGHPQLGQDAGTIAGAGPLAVPLDTELPQGVDVVVDFSLPAAAEVIIETCRRRRVPLVVATTGLEPPQIERLQAAAREIPLLWSPNTSLAVNLTMKLCELAGKALADKDADVEIIERHHRYKEDSPSGTALKFGEILARTMGHTRHRHGRFGRPGKRPHEEIGYHAIRVGDNPGEHTILFGMLGETIELTVRASNRDCYALGALAAAKFLAGKPPGLYGMADVLRGEHLPFPLVDDETQ